MAIYLDAPEPGQEQSLFGDELKRTAGKPGRPRQQAVHCQKCNRLDSVFFGGGVSLWSKRCVHCGGELTTSRARSAKLKLYDAIMQRCASLVIAAARHNGDVEIAVQYAEYAAHTAFKLQLVPYGPEPKR